MGRGLIFLMWGCLAASPPAGAAPADTETNGLALIQAVRQTLELDPVIQIQDRAVAFAEGRVQEEKGRFDARLASAVVHELTQRAEPISVVNTPPATGTTTSFEKFSNRETTFRVGVDQPLRSGLVVGPGLEVTRSDNNLATVNPQNRAGVNFTVIMPLMRGLGRRAATAQEKAAIIDYEASLLDFQHTLSQRILNTTASYWNYLSASRQLEALVQSETRAAQLLANTRGLVQAQEVPAAELDQLEGNLAGKTRLRISAEQQLFEARQGLGLAIGLGFDEVDGLAPARDEFPYENGVQIPAGMSAMSLFQVAMDRRADMKASLLLEESASTLLYLAENNLKPQVDLTLRVGYEGFDEGNQLGDATSAFVENVEGLSGFAALSFDWPPNNNSARGRRAQQQSIYDRSVIRSRNLSRTIRSGLAVALQRLRSGMAELDKASRATLYYRRAVTNEREKQRLGLASFTDVLLVEDRLTGAEIDFIQARQELANAVVELRFESGLLVDGDDTGRLITMNALTTLPREWWREPEPEKPAP